MAAVSIVALIVTPTFLPSLLAFPYAAQSGALRVRSETPIDQAQLDRVARRSAALVASSPLARPAEPRTVYLTQGGWRWRWLALRTPSAFAVSKPFSEAIVIDRADLSRDIATNGQSVGGTRSLSGTIAHETCHGLLRRHFGPQVDFAKPVWLREGYCDLVGGGGSLSDADVAKLRASGQDHPALVYYEGRKRAEAELRRNGNNVDALFAAH